VRGQAGAVTSKQAFYAPGGIRRAQDFVGVINDVLRSCMVGWR